MDIGIGLPTTIPGAEAEQVLEWARRAERRGFSSLGTIDRVAYDNYEPLIALAAAAAVTETIKLATTILIAPYRANPAVLAKQAASVNRLSGGRLVLGIAVGGREDDYADSPVPFNKRGRAFDTMLGVMRGVWAGDRGIGPHGDAPELILGGAAERTFARAAEYGDGWILGGGDANVFRQGAEAVREAWRAANREGQPRLLALGYFSLGSDAERHAQEYLKDYYAFMGPVADHIAAGTPKDDKAIRSAVEMFEQAGVDELILFPCNPDPAQVDMLADVIG